MGMKCPVCGLQVAIVEQIRAGSENKDQPESVIAKRLSCGHTVGEEQYTEFVKGRDLIRKETYQSVQRIEQKSAKRISALWKKLDEEIVEGEDNAE